MPRKTANIVMTANKAITDTIKTGCRPVVWTDCATQRNWVFKEKPLLRGGSDETASANGGQKECSFLSLLGLGPEGG
jgi:hypothetical protein